MRQSGSMSVYLRKLGNLNTISAFMLMFLLIIPCAQNFMAVEPINVQPSSIVPKNDCGITCRNTFNVEEHHAAATQETTTIPFVGMFQIFNIYNWKDKFNLNNPTRMQVSYPCMNSSTTIQCSVCIWNASDIILSTLVNVEVSTRAITWKQYDWLAWPSGIWEGWIPPNAKVGDSVGFGIVKESTTLMVEGANYECWVVRTSDANHYYEKRTGLWVKFAFDSGEEGILVGTNVPLEFVVASRQLIVVNESNKYYSATLNYNNTNKGTVLIPPKSTVPIIETEEEEDVTLGFHVTPITVKLLAFGFDVSVSAIGTVSIGVNVMFLRFSVFYEPGSGFGKCAGFGGGLGVTPAVVDVAGQVCISPKGTVSREFSASLGVVGVDVGLEFTKVSGTSASLGTESNLHVYDAQGRHTGYNHAVRAAEVTIPGSLYRKSSGITTIFLPLNITSFRVEVDSKGVSQPESYMLNITTINQGAVVHQTTQVDKIDQDQKHEYVIQISQDGKTINSTKIEQPWWQQPIPFVGLPLYLVTIVIVAASIAIAFGIAKFSAQRKRRRAQDLYAS